MRRQISNLTRIIRHQPDRLHFQRMEHMRRRAVLALIIMEPERDISVHGIVAVILQPVRTNPSSAQSPALPPHIQENPVSICPSVLKAVSNWSRQSQRNEPIAFPVKHSECSLTGTFSAFVGSPCTNAACSLLSRLFQNDIAWKSPKRVGKSAIAAILTQIWSAPAPGHSWSYSHPATLVFASAINVSQPLFATSFLYVPLLSNLSNPIILRITFHVSRFTRLLSTPYCTTIPHPQTAQL